MLKIVNPRQTSGHTQAHTGIYLPILSVQILFTGIPHVIYYIRTIVFSITTPSAPETI